MNPTAPEAAPVAIFDLDGTLVEFDTFVPFLWACLWRRPTRWWRLPGLLLAALQFKLGIRGNAWLKARFLGAIVGGRTDAQLDRRVQAFVGRLMATGLNRACLERLRAHQRASHRVLLATASPDIYVVPLAEALGIDEVECTRLARGPDGRLLGNLDGGNCYGPGKARRVAARLAGTPASAWVLYTDHQADIPLAGQCGRVVLVNPTPQMAAEMADRAERLC